ncbi:MAG: 23S rRNA (pseudouridine(1915)-N(3))-methyltransferase RlmH [Bauldia sp.]|nr:MAG: 23S rRNA (pseudouridine(1915)-N(3))-methyltransferase RlmH [Bauldia sp.]
MRITLAAIGRLRAGPERELFDRFLDRADQAGGRLGLAFRLREYPENPAGDAATRKHREAAALIADLPAKSAVVALDEHGKSLDSRAFAGRIANWRDSGTAELVFAIGGPDGLGPALLARADLRLAFGAMTWPHQLVRLMLAEQLYRAVTILSGHPYHRD